MKGRIVKTKINPLRFDDVWHPKRGGHPGNRKALKTGAHTASVRAWRARVRDWRQQVNLAPAKAGGELSAF